MESFTNPFTQESQESNKLFNLVTKVVVPEIVQKDHVGQSDIGQKLLDTFVRDRIQDQSMVNHKETEASDLEIHG